MNHIIKLKDVQVKFDFDINSKPDFVSTFKRMFSVFKHSDEKKRYVEALQSVNLEIKNGERVGIIGLNGAGKSTLLKVMAGIYPPTSGYAEISGRVCPLFQFATGFEMNLSGWDNIRVRGMLLGMSPEEIEEKCHSVAEFSELGDFLDYPVRTYSSGMFVRLAFAISTAVEPEILLLDEVLGAGDKNFITKAQNRMSEFIEKGKILVFCSHSMGTIRELCQRVIWLEDGTIKMDGLADDVIAAYLGSS